MNTNLKFSNIIDHGLVLVDTCFILHPGFESFMTCYKDVIFRNPIIILDTIVFELKKLLNNPEKATRVKEALPLVNYYLEKNLLQGRKDFAQQTKHADQVFLRIVQQYHPTNDICILTNDYDFCVDLYKILDQKSNLYHNHQISVLGLKGNSSNRKLALWDKDGSVKDSFFLT